MLYLDECICHVLGLPRRRKTGSSPVNRKADRSKNRFESYRSSIIWFPNLQVPK